MDTVTVYNQMKWKRVVKDLKFFLFLIVSYAQFFFHLSPHLHFSRRIPLLVLWNTWRLILRHGLGCLKFLKIVEMSSWSHGCRLVNCGMDSYFPINWSIQNFYTCKAAYLSSYGFKKNWKKERLALAYESTVWYWPNSELRILKRNVK